MKSPLLGIRLERAIEYDNLAQEYAAPIREQYPGHSAHSPENIMVIIETEEFGGTLTDRELSSAGQYLSQISSAAYASLRFFGKIRARYFLRIL